MTTQERKAVEAFAERQCNSKQLFCSNRLGESVGAYEDGKKEGIILGAEFALSELRKPSEDLVNQIIELLLERSIDSPANHGYKRIYQNDFRELATEIANLVSSSRRQENGSEKLPHPKTNKVINDELKAIKTRTDETDL